jgi:hypothetical protein
MLCDAWQLSERCVRLAFRSQRGKHHFIQVGGQRQRV